MLITLRNWDMNTRKKKSQNDVKFCVNMSHFLIYFFCIFSKEQFFKQGVFFQKPFRHLPIVKALHQLTLQPCVVTIKGIKQKHLYTHF